MEEHVVKILEIKELTHDVKSFKIEKPAGYHFRPGQATEVSVNNNQWRSEKRPFTFTSLEEDPFLEFVIKRYSDHNGVTNALHNLKEGGELLIHDVWGAIHYKGKGVFIAGGAGITPFLAILRRLHKDGRITGNRLIFSNKTSRDIILKNELEKMLGQNLINVITGEKVPGIRHERIDKNYLKEVISDFSGNFYICGPEPFTASIQQALGESGVQADAIVFEK